MESPEEPDGPGGRLYGSDYEYHKVMATNVTTRDDNYEDDSKPKFVHEEHPWGIFFTVLGTVLLDFDADACQSPSRAYLLDVTTAGKCYLEVSIGWSMSNNGYTFQLSFCQI